MSTLTGRQISDTYKQLVKLAVSANAGVSADLTQIQTGDGTNIAFQVATGAAKATGTFGVDGNASVSGNVQIGGTVSIDGANVAAPNAKVCASAFYGDGSNITGVNSSIGGNVCVGNISVVGNAYVSGTSQFVSKVEFDDDVCVSGNTVLVGNLAVGGTTTITGAVSLGSTLDVAGNVSVSGTFKGTVLQLSEVLQV